MNATLIATPEQTPKPVSRLAALYGLPPAIRTEYATRQDPDRQTPARQVQCPKCLTWQALTHNAHCTGCLINLAYVVVPNHVQPSPATIETPEPVAVEETAQVQTVEEIAAGIDHIKDVLAAWDAACEEPTATPEQVQAVAEEMSIPVEEVATIAAIAAQANALKQQFAEQHQAELEAGYYTEASGQYTLTCQVKNGLAVDCTCLDRVKKGRFQGRACKHMMGHNATLTPAAKVAA